VVLDTEAITKTEVPIQRVQSEMGQEAGLEISLQCESNRPIQKTGLDRGTPLT